MRHAEHDVGVGQHVAGTLGISLRSPVPCACNASACTRLPRPMAAIFISPLSYRPWKSVCCFTRLTTMVAAAAAA